MFRHTKIVATLGPASCDPKTLETLIRAGVNVFRLNFSHGKAEEHAALAASVREIASMLGQPIGILADLQGPKIRIGKFESGKIMLAEGDRFILDAACELGNQERVGLDYKNLPHDVGPGDILLLNDGRIELEVKHVLDHAIDTRVIQGGELSNNKGINRQGGGLSAPSLTPKDMEDIKTAAQIGVDFLAVSFPKSASDMYMAKQLMLAAGGHALTIAKIERTEAVSALEEILDASDGLMVARGDLAVEVGDAVVPALQKRMIRLAQKKNKLVITATQMMESMVFSPTPTRAEVSDVANAVLDGTDAVMLSAESAIGHYPVQTVRSMARICAEAEKSMPITLDREFLNRAFVRIDQSVAMAAVFAAFHLKAKAIAALTTTGSTVLWLSRMNSGIPIFALMPGLETYTRLTLYRGAIPLLMKHSDEHSTLRHKVDECLLQAGVVKKGDLIVLTYGDHAVRTRDTNTMSIIRAGEVASPTT